MSTSPAAAPRFHAFLSYSHAADTRTAAALQSALQRIGKRWFRPAAVRVFRDQTSLAAAPGLWTEIERHLADSAWFVLMATPEAAASPWVDKEVRWWLTHRSADRILIVLSGGELAWDARAGRFAAPASTSLPPALHGAFAEEPLWVDLRWAAAEPQLSLRHTRFRDAVLTLSARLQGRDKDALDSAEIREHRRFVRAAWATGIGFNVVLLVAAAAWWQARTQQQRAEENWRQSQSQRLAAMALEALDQGHLDDASQLAVLAWRLDDSQVAVTALRRIVDSGPSVAAALGGHTDRVKLLGFSGDGRVLVSGGGDGSLMRWRTADWQPDGPLLPNPDPAASGLDRRLHGVRVDTTGEHVFAWKDTGRGWWWQPRSGRVRPLDLALPERTYLSNAAIAPQGDRVLLTLSDKALLWRPEDGSLRPLPLPAWGQEWLGGCFAGPDRLRLVARTKQRIAYIYDGLRIVDWRLDDGSRREGPVSRTGHTHSFHVVSSGVEPTWSSDCSQFVIWDDRRPSVWRVDAALAIEREVAVDTRAVADPHGHGDVAAWFVGRRAGFAAVADDRLGGGQWAHWGDGEPASAPATSLPGAFLPLAASADGRWLAAAGGEGLLLWDSRAGPWGTPAARRLAVACSGADDDCATRLCEAAGKRFDEARLRQLFGIADFRYFYDTYKRIVDAAACPVPRRPIVVRPVGTIRSGDADARAR